MGNEVRVTTATGVFTPGHDGNHEGVVGATFIPPPQVGRTVCSGERVPNLKRFGILVSQVECW